MEVKIRKAAENDKDTFINFVMKLSRFNRSNHDNACKYDDYQLVLDALEKNLPVERVEYTLDNIDCPQCDSTLHVMSQEVRKEIAIIPAQVKVVEHVRHVYTCRTCEQQATNTPVITASMPAPVLFCVSKKENTHPNHHRKMKFIQRTSR